MPVMGKPVNIQERSYQGVTMAPRQAQPSAADLDKIAAKEKKRLLDNLTGYKEKNPLYKDAKTHNKMGKDEFLKLLTVQLKNQDPMNPMEQGKMAAELAQFSSLEQLSNINKNFEGMNKGKAMQDKFYGASFLGKEVVTSGTSLKFEGEGTQADILFNLPKPAEKVLVRIFDGNKQMVGEVWQENIGRGNQTFAWDGTQLDGAISGKGEFTTAVYAWDNNADPIEVKTKNTGVVESVYFENGETILMVDGKKVFLRDVDSFHTAGALQHGQSAGAAQPNAPINTGAHSGPSMNQVMGKKSPSANSVSSNLPIAQSRQAKVNLNKVNNQTGHQAYKNAEPVNKPSTGITNVYDVQ
ncbi:MAG: hypothetical protein CME62_14545 [Halobacteriovoraceae bacterium]|nr:hypothetical protein [Halobacteriovoraceae bacterium]